jgi:glycosyltransferase involved in cell wall biosynthesis
MGNQDAIPLLSIVVPISKMAGKLGNLERWLFALNEPEVEVVIVHDKCDEETGPELAGILTKINSRRVRIFEVGFKSPGLTRNFGLEKISGKWVQFVDSDDVPEINRSIELIYEATLGTEVIQGLYQYHDLTTNQSNSIKRSSNYRIDIAMNPGLWRFLFAVSSIENIKFSKYRMGEDQLFLLDYNIFSRKIFYSNSIIYTYYVGQPGQLTSSRNSIKELSQIIPLTFTKFRECDFAVAEFTAVVLARQLITFTKNFPIFALCNAFKLFFAQIMKLPFQKNLWLIRSFSTVIKERKRSCED